MKETVLIFWLCVAAGSLILKRVSDVALLSFIPISMMTDKFLRKSSCSQMPGSCQAVVRLLYGVVMKQLLDSCEVIAESF